MSKKSYIGFGDNFNFGELVFLASLIVGELVCRRVRLSASLSVGELSIKLLRPPTYGHMADKQQLNLSCMVTKLDKRKISTGSTTPPPRPGHARDLFAIDPLDIYSSWSISVNRIK